MPRLGSDETDCLLSPHMAQRVHLGDRHDLADKRSGLPDDNARGVRKIASSGKDDAHTGAIEKLVLARSIGEIPRSLGAAPNPLRSRCPLISVFGNAPELKNTSDSYDDDDQRASSGCDK